MLQLDSVLSEAHRWIRDSALLYRLTLGTRVLLAAGFIPTGMVKLLGYRFTRMSPDTEIGGFFETLYQSGPYWHFIGLAQVLAGVLVLWPATATLGALLFFPIMLNIFVITISYDFNYTPVVTGAMLLAALYLLVWDYHRLRGIFGITEVDAPLPRHRLSGSVERGAYVGGTVAGLAFFSGTRGLLVPWQANQWLLLGCVASFAVAAWYGLFRRSRPAMVSLHLPPRRPR